MFIKKDISPGSRHGRKTIGTSLGKLATVNGVLVFRFFSNDWIITNRDRRVG